MKVSAASLGKSHGSSFSAIKVEEVAKVIEKQGIVSILGSDCERSTKAAATSLRRTLSADMSSKKWLSQHGFFPIKKIASSQEFPISSIADSSSSSSSEGDEEYELERSGQDDVWRSIQAEKEKKKKELEEKPGQFDNIWSSILSQKANSDDSSKLLPPPYIHPLVKRSSSLSEKSLEVCTESLGSETGSDGFSYPPSETGDDDDAEDQEKEELQAQEKESQSQSFDSTIKYSYSTATSKKCLPRSSFPPPLPSSIARRDGPSLQMKSHRQNGRLVLEVVSLPTQNYFHAQRQDGRLLLTFVNGPAQESNHGDQQMIDQEEEGEEEEFAEVFEAEANEEDKDEDDDDDYDDEEEEEMGIIVMEQALKLSSAVINVHRSAVMMNKQLIGINNNKNLIWSQKFNKGLNLVEMEEEEEVMVVATQLPQSLPPPPRVARLIPAAWPAVVAAAASLNAYEYFWRTKPTMINPLAQHCPPLKNSWNMVKLSNSTSPKAYDQQQTDYLVRGCKEPRRSLIWEPYCIATS